MTARGGREGTSDGGRHQLRAARDNAVVMHATAIAVDGRAALIRGPSGSGKSDLALRCLATAPNALTGGRACLVADDQVEVARAADGLVVTAPAAIRGRLEVRGFGIIELEVTEAAILALVCDLAPADDPIERLPEADCHAILMGQPVKLIRLHPFEASAPAKLLLALSRN